MRTILSVSAIGAVAAALTLAAPSESSAQGLSIQFGYNQGGYHGGYPAGGPAYGPGYGGGYGPGCGYRHGHYHGGPYHIYQPRPVIVQPEYYHWTPGRGYHSHREVIVPHRGHYDVIPY